MNYADIKIGRQNLDYRSSSLYQMAGSFSKHLIEDYPNGPAKYLSLIKYTLCSSDTVEPDFDRFKMGIEKIYSTPFSKVIDNWNAALKPYWGREYPVDASDLAGIQLSLDTHSEKLLKVYYDSFKSFLRLVAFTQKGKKAVLTATQENGWRILSIK